MRLFIIAAALCMSILSGSAKTVNLYFAGGQSNAKAAWASAIESELSRFIQDVEVVTTLHSGNAMAAWYTTSAQANYETDFYNAGGTGLLQSRIAAIEAAGDVVNFKGFFWFQGESDTGSTNTIDLYAGRYSGMLSELKSDLGMSADVDFAMALIDMNSDSFYDDPANTGGRTRGIVEYMRTAQSNICNSVSGVLEDTRGYNRTDTWHLPEADLIELGTAMAYTHLATFSTVASTNLVEVISHAADGSIYGTSGSFDIDLIAGLTGSTVYNGISFFEIPEGEIVATALSFTCDSDLGDLPAGVNLDLWALGYQSTPVRISAWGLQADTDTRLLLNGEPPVKIADNYVDAGEATPAGGVWPISAAEGVTLTTFVNGVLAAGAVVGDYIAMRINPDGALSAVAGTRFGSSNRGSVPVLTYTVVTQVPPLPLVPPGVETGYWRVISDDEDGAISESGGKFTTQTLISSTGGGGQEPWNGICFFELPPQPLVDADMELTVVTDYIAGVITTNIDLWGLGYQTTPVLTTSWYISADADTRILLNGASPVKIADNIVKAGVSESVGDVWSPDAAERVVLKDYINSLYGLGAKPGDCAVMRVNMDARVSGVNYGIRWGSSADAGREPIFTGNFTPAENRLLNPGMELGDQGLNVTSWPVSRNSFLLNHTNVTPRSGSYVMRIGVGGDQTGNTANNINCYQDVTRDDWEGKLVTFSCYARHNADEPLVTGSIQKLELRLWLYDSSNTLLSSVNSTVDNQLFPTDTVDLYKELKVSTVMPAGTAKVRAMFIFRTATVDDPSITTGAVMVDDARLEIFTPIPEVVPLGTHFIIR